jgi:hypothetical protein
MTGTSAAGYVRSQAIGAALVNAVLNPVIEWVLNRAKGFQPLWGDDGVVVNMAITSVILSVLVALFAARGVRHEVAIGRLTEDRTVRHPLRWLPRRAGWIGLLFGVVAAVAVALVCWLLARAGVNGLSFAGLLILKALYCGALGFVVARCTIVRLLSHPGAALPSPRPSAS